MLKSGIIIVLVEWIGLDGAGKAPSSKEAEMAALRMEKSATDYMEPMLHGYVQRTAEYASAWKCSDCGLVWQKKWYADTCGDRGHKSAFQQHYGGYVLNGKYVGGTSYTRQALRRELADLRSASS